MNNILNFDISTQKKTPKIGDSVTIELQGKFVREISKGIWLIETNQGEILLPDSFINQYRYD